MNHLPRVRKGTASRQADKVDLGGQREFCIFAEMETSGKTTARIIATLFATKGVRRVFASPGSRNTPLLMALEREPGITLSMVVDERSAAFMAAGYCDISGEPVGLVCTSGSAVLNYAPAIAEARYRHLPLIAVSADRPEAWIDQDDSQTLPQPGILGQLVKRSYNLPDISSNDRQGQWWANRTVNDALLLAESEPRGPVHINLQFDNPLNSLSAAPLSLQAQRNITIVAPAPQLSTGEMRRLGATVASPCRVMIVAGFMPPDHRISRAIERLAAKPNITVMCESMSNLHARRVIGNIDRTLSTLSSEEKESLRPDIVITLGGALLSRYIKDYLRAYPPQRHWHVGITHNTIDCLQSLTTRISISPRQFFPALASALQPYDTPCDYAAHWLKKSQEGAESHRSFTDAAQWSALKGFDIIVRKIPRQCNVQLSNGTCARYFQLCDYTGIHRCDCNRGVSGIDGCTSTAIGASLAYSHHTWLLTGDMSALYDIGSLASPLISPKLKIVVSVNDGGGIFRFIASTRSLPEMNRCMAMSGMKLPLRELAAAWGFAFFEAGSEAELNAVLPHFAAEKKRPALLAMKTDGELDAQLLQNYFNRNK